MEKNIGYNLMIDFIKAKAEKYKALKERNAFVDKRLYSDYDLTDNEYQEVTNNFNYLSVLSLEGEYRLVNFLSNLKLCDLNTFNDMIKNYSKKREDEIKRLSVNLVLEEEKDKIKSDIEYFEKYERPSIKDLHYMVARQKGKLFGMSNEEAYLYASREMENLIDIDILELDFDKLKEKVRSK